MPATNGLTENTANALDRSQRKFALVTALTDFWIAMAAASASRSFFGCVLPFGARPRYARCGTGTEKLYIDSTCSKPPHHGFDIPITLETEV